MAGYEAALRHAGTEAAMVDRTWHHPADMLDWGRFALRGEEIMKLNSFLMFATIVAGVFGLAFLLAPSQLVAMYGVTLTPATEVIGRVAGSTILAFAIAFWGARNSDGAEALKAVMVAGLVGNGLDALILLHATVTGLLNGLGWLQVLINGALAVGFWYFSFGKGKTA
jgi:hypothetical protein